MLLTCLFGFLPEVLSTCRKAKSLTDGMKTTSLLPMSKAFASRLKSSATLIGETAGRMLQGYEVMNMIVCRVGEQVVLPGRSAEDVYGEGESRTARDRYSG